VITVLGGGPAGATVSRLLASWGHTVRLIAKPGLENSHGVSLPPSCRKLFEAIGLGDAFERAGYLPSTGNTVWWGGADARVENFAPGTHGWQVNLSSLSSWMLQRAIAAGVAVEHQIIVDVPTGFVLDCSGRAGIVARAKSVRRQGAATKTIALVGAWRRNDPWPVPDETHTVIESYDDGWVWSLAVSPSIRHIAAMVDPQRSGLIGGSKKGVYLAEIAKTREFKHLITGASMIGGPWGWDVSPYDSVEYANDDWMLVGDAGSFVDPLSSAGVKKAMASGWLAAIVAHTCLVSPSMKNAAVAFFNAREREIAAHLQRESRQFLSDAASGHPHAFWDERSDDGEADASDADEVRGAFDRLKSAQLFRMARGAVRVEDRPCIRGREIVLEPQLVPEGASNGLRYIRNVDIVALIEMAPAARQVPDLYEAYQNRLGATPLDDFLFALATAVARGWLVAE
jgi:flavin-dependent dehydrogenase